MSSAAAFAANEAIRSGEFDSFLDELLRTVQARRELIDHSRKPKTWLPPGQVWAWMNGPGTPHWEPRGTGVILPPELEAEHRARRGQS